MQRIISFHECPDLSPPFHGCSGSGMVRPARTNPILGITGRERIPACKGFGEPPLTEAPLRSSLFRALEKSRMLYESGFIREALLGSVAALEFALKEALGTNEALCVLIFKAHAAGFLTNVEMDGLHRLRLRRNALVHEHHAILDEPEAFDALVTCSEAIDKILRLSTNAKG